MLNCIKNIIYKILGKCLNCNTYFRYPKRRRMNTAYLDDKSNYEVCCLSCHKEHEECWDEMWEEYNSERY